MPNMVHFLTRLTHAPECIRGITLRFRGTPTCYEPLVASSEVVPSSDCSVAHDGAPELTRSAADGRGERSAPKEKTKTGNRILVRDSAMIQSN